jgi:hypothetical protein
MTLTLVEMCTRSQSLSVHASLACTFIHVSFQITHALCVVFHVAKRSEKVNRQGKAYLKLEAAIYEKLAVIIAGVWMNGSMHGVMGSAAATCFKMRYNLS